MQTSTMKNTLSIKQIFPLFMLNLIILLSFNVYSGEDDVIFVNSFEAIELGEFSFVTPNVDETFDKEIIAVRVKVGLLVSNLQTVKINQIRASLVSQSVEFAEYEVQLTLSQGLNTLVGQAIFDDGLATIETTINYFPLSEVTISSPIDWQTFGAIAGAGGSLDLTGMVQRPITITGTLGNSSDIVGVQINQQQAVVTGDAFIFEDFFLHEGSNFLNVVATDEFDRETHAQITVYVDQTAPLLSVVGLDDRITSASKIDITGTVNDAVEADFNAAIVNVSISNTATNDIFDAQVLGLNYLAPNINLVVGNNPLLITATDAYGNSRDLQASVTRIAAGANRITLFSGNKQTGATNELLAEPLKISAFDKNGQPLSGLPIHFDVIRGAGSISTLSDIQDLSDGINPNRNLVVPTDTSGQAQVWLTLGEQAGLSNHIIRVYTEELAEEIYFNANTTTGQAHKILIEGASGTQYAQNNSQPIEALTVIVMDQNNNPLANSSVIFTVNNGDAYFKESSAINSEVLSSGQSIRTFTDKKGQAAVRPYLGPQDGNVIISARVELSANNFIGNASFHIVVLQRKDGATQFSGIVMDHSGTPLAGIKFSIQRTTMNALSDASGYFNFTGDIPIGKIDLFVDGRDVQVVQNGETIEYPALHFETAIIQGQKNQLPHPIYLPPVHIENTVTVGGSEDSVLTIPNFQGFKMIVKAGSVTFPDGSTEGELVVNPVHNDRLPMVPPGVTGRFMATGWTLQPTGTRFDPPIEVHIPNVDGLKPGTTIPIVQWDHDLALFVPIGLGTTNEDASLVITNPGSGISKAGWGGGPPPPPPTDTAKCSDNGSCSCKLTITVDDDEETYWEIQAEDGVDVDFEATLSGNNCGGDLSYEWTFTIGSEVIISNEKSPTQHFDDAKAYQVKLSVTCESCTPNLFTDTIIVNIFVPVILLEEDERHKNGYFELIEGGGLLGKYYLERTNLKITVFYPELHPKQDQVISDYSGEAKIEENSRTSYYDDKDGASDLSDEIEIEKGIGLISIDSISDEIANSEGSNGWPKEAEIEIEIEEFDHEDVDSIMSLDVKQWVTDSEVDLGGANDPNTPDWLEKHIWDELESYGNDGGIVTKVMTAITTIQLADPSQISEGAECGHMPLGPDDTIWIGVTCHIQGEQNENMHRRNTSQRLEKTLLIQSRQAWQNGQLLLDAANATGATPKQDSDHDGCPEVVLNDETEAGPLDATSIQDGVAPTTGDDGENSADTGIYNAQSPYEPWSSLKVSKCEFLKKKDAIQFMNDHKHIF